VIPLHAADAILDDVRLRVFLAFPPGPAASRSSPQSCSWPQLLWPVWRTPPRYLRRFHRFNLPQRPRRLWSIQLVQHWIRRPVEGFSTSRNHGLFLEVVEYAKFCFHYLNSMWLMTFLTVFSISWADVSVLCDSAIFSAGIYCGSRKNWKWDDPNFVLGRRR